MKLRTLLFLYVSNTYTHISLQPGSYKFELWGASGDDQDGHNYSRGGYVSGTIVFTELIDLYLYIGEHGSWKTQPSFNGGGAGSSKSGYSGGGATDIRLTEGNWNDFQSLLSRIIVAGGGGGTLRNDGYDDEKIIDKNFDSHAGGLIGGSGDVRWDRAYPNIITNSEGGTQERPGQSGKCTANRCTYPTPSGANFGIGGGSQASHGGGGGGGYFGGGAGYVANGIVGSGGGGSSFVSGCDGCIAMSNKSTFSNLIPHNSNIHYSNKVFKNIVIRGGNEYFLSPKGINERGHFGHGAIKITFLSFYNCKKFPFSQLLIFLGIFILTYKK